MATMYDVARKAGVSQATVSCVLNARYVSSRVSEATRRRVLQAASELGYQPNASARTMSTGRFGCVALLQSADPQHSYLTASLFDGIHQALAAHDLHLVVARVPDEQLVAEGFLPKALRQYLSDGLLVNYTVDVPDAFTAVVRQSSQPVVWLNRKLDADCLYPDDLGAGRQVTRALLQRGHRRIAFFSIPCSHYSEADRWEGYLTEMAAAGLPARRVGAGEGEDDVAAIRACLAGPDRPTAIVAYTPYLAKYAAVAALQAGLRVPEDLSLATFDGQVVFDLGFVISTCLLPEHTMGAAGVEMLLAKIGEPGSPLPARVLPCTFYEGHTCVLPPEEKHP